MRIRRWFAVLTLLGAGTALAQNAYFGDWPAGSDPREVGRRVAERFIPTPHMEMPGHGPQALHYSHVATWVGALQFAGVTGDQALMSRLVARFEPFLATDAPRVPRSNHVDADVFGALPLELYRQTHRYQYRLMGLAFADGQWDNPLPDGLSNQTRWWIDDMYMITALQLQAFRATGDVKYRDRAAREMAAYLRKLQQPNGLFFHAADVPFYWGRGDGWVAVGMAEMLRDLPEKHALRKPILAAYRRMMATLLSYQAQNGMWRQLIDHPESWEETSSTAMFTYAFVTGVKNGWLAEASYGPAARKAWIALTGYLTPDGDLREICVGTGKKNDLQYYLDRPRAVGDGHGQAPMLWSATALVR
ncbi:MAG TPA: glycoside hydrolase family 88 protein [Steroidobacteraceae bacterium]|jgi:rhamnogalacturonyl hydrolase YesR|nr:glycoside hydrolase family 88 protein [Steroidobacteraceae bacterium]